MKSLVILSVVLSLLILGSNGQSGELFVFDWPGPLEVPVGQAAIQPPDRVLFVFANATTDRLLRIREGVFATFDCSVLLDQLFNSNIPDGEANWFVTKFDTANMPDPSGIQPVDGDSEKYDIFGSGNRFLNITNPILPTIAGEGESGIYTCEACGTMLNLGAPPTRVCINSSTTLLIEADPPIIATSTDTRDISGFLGFNVGNDFCIRSPPVGNTITGLDVLCLHNQSFTIPIDPPPVATWSFNGAPITGSIPVFILADDLRGGLGMNGQLTIDPLMPTAPYVGVYMCNLTSIHGQDSATTRIFNSDLSASVSISGLSDNGCSRFNINPQATTICAGIGEDVTVMCSAPGDPTLSGPGGLLTRESSLTLSSITPSQGGMYTCNSGAPCNDEMTFTIITFDFAAPTIVNTTDIIDEGTASAIHSIGTDLICIRASNDPARIRILCGHDINNKVDPLPVATWTFPRPQAEDASELSNSPLRLGNNTLLTIDNDGDPISQLSQLQGDYTCTLANSQGSDVGTVRIDVFPNIVSANGGFVFSQSEVSVTIGNSTCQFLGGENRQTNELVDIACNEMNGIFDTSWTFNGQPLSTTDRTITNIGPGIYACTKRSACGSLTVTTTILDVPEIAEPTGPPPTDGPGVVYEIGQSVCVDASQSGDVVISCPKPTMNTDPDFIYVSWSKVGDPSFSFTESELRIPRSDPMGAGVYVCELSSGGEADDQKCGRSTANSTVSFQSSINEGSGFIAGSPDSFGNVISVGSDTCAPPEGQSLRIRCETIPTIPVSWDIDGTSVPGNEFIDVTTSGTYTCGGTDGCGNALTASSDIIPVNSVAISSMIVGRNNSGCDRFNNAPPSASVCPIAGEMVIIQCMSSSGTYEISFDGTSQSSNQPLNLSPFVDRDAGIYTCTSTGNQCGTPSDSLEIFAGGLPPLIPPFMGTNPPPGTISVGNETCLSFGESINITCVASGSQPITFAWRKSPSQAVISTANTITVREIGEYNCTATNNIGTDSALSRIIEDIEVVFNLTGDSQSSRCSDLNVPPMNTDKCFFAGDSVTLSCRSRVSMTPGVIQPGGDIGTKVISDLSQSDTMFSCSISNECSNRTSNLIFLIQEPARIDRMSPLPPSSDSERNIGAGRPDEPVIVQDNVTVRLFCPYTGFDEPTTRWVIVNRDRSTTDVVANPPNVIITDVNNTLILEIRNFNDDLEGTYRCVTGNNAGNDDGDIILRFQPPEPGEWTTTQWGQCDPDCHRGVRMREVTCVGVNTRLLLPDNRCTDMKPATTEQCSGPCFLDPVWVPRDWSECSQDCGGGYRLRKLDCCIPRTNEVVDDSRCDDSLRPTWFEYCNTHPCCTGDDYPNFCPLILGTSLCEQDVFKRACCWTCR